MSGLTGVTPKSRKAAFTGTIVIEAHIKLSELDVEELAEAYLKTRKLILDKDRLSREFYFQKIYQFKDSEYTGTRVLWTITLHLKTKRARVYRAYEGNRKDEALYDDWHFGTEFLQKRMPKVVYFPTFLFDFPDRIYLEGDDGEVNSYYKAIVQDVLDSQGDDLEVDKHIVDRIKRLRDKHKSPSTFISHLFSSDEKKQIDAVLQSASNEMSRVIFGAWDHILGRNVAGKRVQIDWALDGEKSNSPYLEVTIVDGQSKFSLSERSLGFRWFFSFLLFTQFRKNRKSAGATIFLFDEPAANLHSKAQIRLLESFAKVARDQTYIVYSTHSHYMINPLWLEKAYIVENKATDYESDEQIASFAVVRTDVNAVRYKTFVGTYPSRTTYFQPVLDALQVSFSPLVRSSRAVIIEGKYDYHSYVYFRKRISTASDLDIYPANGANDIGVMINLLRGWGTKFFVLLDDDDAGQTAKAKYVEDYFLSPSEIATLGDINAALKGKAFEGIYQADVRADIPIANRTSRLGKKDFSLHFQELLASNIVKPYPQTEAVFSDVSTWVDKHMLDKI